MKPVKKAEPAKEEESDISLPSFSDEEEAPKAKMTGKRVQPEEV